MSDETKPDETKPDQLATTEDEAGSPLKVVTDFLSTLNLPDSIIPNAVKAFGRLCTAGIGWPIAYLEGKAAEIQAGTEARIKIIENIAAQINQQIKVPSEYARRTADIFAQKIIREQVNLDEISAVAANELNKAESESSTDQSTNAENEEEQTINDDWLNSFEEEARQKSTEEMQLLFGRILAGEIRKPGTYSIRTVKILGELDQNVAILFKKLCSVCVVIEDPVSGSIVDARVSAFGVDPRFTDPRSNALIEYGLGFENLNILNEYGLIISDYNSVFPYITCVGNENHTVAASFRHQGRYWALFSLPGWDKDWKQFYLSGVALSRTGRELFAIVDQDPMEQYTEDLKKFFAEKHLQMIEVNKP